MTNYQGQTASQIVSKLKTNLNIFFSRDNKIKRNVWFGNIARVFLVILKCQSDKYAYRNGKF